MNRTKPKILFVDMNTISKISKKEISKLLEQWAGEFNVFVPAIDNKTSKMAKWDGKDLSFLNWYRNTSIPPKDMFFPLVEEMFHYNKDKDGYRIDMPPSDTGKKLIFGIRPCDAAALAMLDKAFSDGYEDSYYLARRRDTVLVGLTCTMPYDSCFCTSLEGSPSESKNVDIVLTDTGNDYLVEAITEKGQELMAKTTSLKQATEADITLAKQVVEAAYQKVSRRVNTKDISKRLRDNLENKEFWEQVGTKCISCGVCTFFCPTCYCFDIADSVAKKQGKRQRNWDSCQFPVYTKMPMENPRDEKWRRVRQKVCHKYAYFPEIYGNIACTGCGRCIRMCPVNWDITQVINDVPEKVQVESK